MGKYTYNDDEYDINKILKYNQDLSFNLAKDMESTESSLDTGIAEAEALLRSLGKKVPQNRIKDAVPLVKNQLSTTITDTPLPTWDDLVAKANSSIEHKVELEDILTEKEFQTAYDNLDKIENEFDKKTHLNSIDKKILFFATSVLTIKTLVTPYILKKLEYGNSFDPNQRMKHNDPAIAKEHRAANDSFRDTASKYHEQGYWMNILYQTPPFDTTVGSPSIGFNMEGGYHRLHTLGHDPVLGWVFGTANILTDTVTLDNLETYRVIRKPKLMITPQAVSLADMFQESFEMSKADLLNLPAALFAEAQHLKSDRYTKAGLPVPLLSTFAPELAGELYKSQYDELCFIRDIKFVGMSAAISTFFNMIITFVHSLYFDGKSDKRLYEVRTRKILLIANSIAGGSSIISAFITKNPKNLDLGQLLVSVKRLFSDIRYICKIKEEYISQEQDKALLKSLQELDYLESQMR